MTKKTQKKSRNRRGPTVRQVGGAIAQKYPSVAEMAAKIGQGLVHSAVKLGEHRARAELLAPILAGMQDVSRSRTDRSARTHITLTPSGCDIVMACLAEAGYHPQQQGGEEFAFPQAWCGVPGDSAAQNGCDEKVPPVAKAA